MVRVSGHVHAPLLQGWEGRVPLPRGSPHTPWHLSSSANLHGSGTTLTWWEEQSQRNVTLPVNEFDLKNTPWLEGD